MHIQSRTVGTPLKDLDYSLLNPGSAALEALQRRMK